MRKLFLSFVAAMLATFTYAQTSLLATLSHDGNITTFYGANALRDAHEAAVSGDVITLSSGTFQATNITKAITLRGAGMKMNAELMSEPSVILGDFNIEIPETDVNTLTIEGIYHNYTITVKCVLKNATFLKCRLGNVEIYYDHHIYMEECTFIHSETMGRFIAHTDASTVTFINSVIRVNDRVNGIKEFTNCIVLSNNASNIYGSSCKNCIFLFKEDYTYIGFRGNNSIEYNCIANQPSAFNNNSNSTNRYVPLEEIFKTPMNLDTNIDDWDFELTDEAKTTYLGIDGTEVGIYGGSLPFDPTPTNPQITKFNVASKTTADGKLSVDIEIKAAE